MSRWKLFSRTKKDVLIQENNKYQSQITEDNQKQETDIIPENSQKDEPLVEYSETLYSGASKTKKIKNKPSTDQRIWRDVDLIEEKIDDLHIIQEKKYKSDIEKRVDHLVSDIKIEKKPIIHKKISDIIYVLSKPQPGELKGDWAVERNGIITSHHKTKENAIKEARKLAKRKKNGRVMIQNIDGSFDKPFKPKKR